MQNFSEYPREHHEEDTPKLNPNDLKFLLINHLPPTVKILSPGQYGRVFLSHTLYNFCGTYVLQGKKIGSGSWADVYICRKFRPNLTKENGWEIDLCVIKNLKMENIRQHFLNTTVGMKENMRMESRLVNGHYLEIENQCAMEMLEYAGESLTAYFTMSKPAGINSITLSQWLLAFIDLVGNLQKDHQDKKKIHCDIKPDNICIRIGLWKKEANENVKQPYVNPSSSLVKLTLIDWASAANEGEIKLPGDKKYQPPEIWNVIPCRKYYEADIFSLGKTLSEILSNVTKYINKQNITMACEELFNRMMQAEPSKRPTLNNVIKTLSEIRDKCDDSESYVKSRNLTPS